MLEAGQNEIFVICSSSNILEINPKSPFITSEHIALTLIAVKVDHKKPKTSTDVKSKFVTFWLYET